MHKSLSFFCLLFICYSCNGDTIIDISLENRIPFTMDYFGEIECDVKINDSIPAKFVFDTGTDALLIDSVFWHTHYPDKKGLPAGLFFAPFAFSLFRVELHEYPIFLNKKNSKFIFNQFYTIANTGLQFQEIKGFLNIPSDDTTHIWEINFENNYIQVHNDFTFNTNKQAITLPLKRKINEDGHQQFLIDLPLKIICGNDTLVSKTEYSVDVGSSYDIFYHRKDQREVQFLEKYGQNTPIVKGSAPTGRIRRNIVQCIVFENYLVDSFRIYNSELILKTDINNDTDSSKTIGTNFLKRFNLFFDLKKNYITFIPIGKPHQIVENFKHETNSNFVLFKNPSDPDSNICIHRFLIVEKGNVNIFKEMGVQVGDNLISLNGIQIKGKKSDECYFFISETINNSDTIELVIKRKDKLITLYYNKPK